MSGDDGGALTYHERVRLYQRCLIEAAVYAAGGNRTRAARRLGLQRTYLLRLVRELGCTLPPAPHWRRR